MTLSYDNFRKRYLRQAGVLCNNMGHPELSEKLCKAGFEAVISRPECYPNQFDVYVELARIAYLWNPSTELLFNRIYYKKKIPLDKELISYEECIEKLLPILEIFPLHDRIIASLSLLGWKYSTIAKLFNELIDNFSKDITSARTLTQADEILKRFIKKLTEKVLYRHDIKSWFLKLMEHKNNINSDYETWQYLVNICFVPENLRFARKNNPKGDNNARLRDRYNDSKKIICIHLKESDFFESNKDGQ